MRSFEMAIWVLVTVGCCIQASADSRIEQARKQRRAFGEERMAKILAEPVAHPLVYALAGLYTGKDIAGANKQILEAWATAAGPGKTMTPELAAAEPVKWCMRGWLRIYYLFNDKSAFFPGRLEKDVQAKLEEMFFMYGCHKSTIHRAQLANIWFIQGSENHDMMDLSNAYLALQAVQDLPLYKERKLPDGHMPAEHVRAWEAYYAQYALERAKNGLFVEISPTYGKWFVGEFVNMYQFAESPVIRKRMEMLLHLMWADWSVDELNGTRGGGKTRCYQGGYSQKGSSDAWDLMAQDLMGMKAWFWNSHGNLSTMALATSTYELPDVVLDMALNKSDTTPFVYQSARPAKLVDPPKNPPQEKGNWMDGSGGRILRYSYCTPESVMGSWMLDTRVEYAAINSQNRWQGVIFATGPSMRVFPESEGLGNGMTYNQHIAAQHRNAMIVMNHPEAKQTGQMSVFFPAAMRERIVERDGWVVVNEGGAWLGVRSLGGKGYDLKATEKKTPKEASRENDDGFWLWPKEDNAAVALVLSRISVHKTADEFLAYIGSHEYGVSDGKASYTFVDDEGKKSTLELGGKLPIPMVGKQVDLQPKMVFDSPYLRSDHGSGIVTLEKGARKLVLDFNEKLIK